ncbi:DUF2793 domain-containing protein [Erythrobacter insulae]|nr:DUF2793 domain-containing protein [Erythrobacter insulae]
MITWGLLPFAIEDSLGAPPAETTDGKCYRIDSSPTGEWAERENQIALKVAGAWVFIAPQKGMRVFDRSTNQFWVFKSNWVKAMEPESPVGGNVIDTEARAAIEALTQALRNAGIFPTSA